MLKRTMNDIVARIKEIESSDFFGFETTDLLAYLDHDRAKPFLKEGAVWPKDFPTSKDPVEEIKNYMPFAWEKANDCRGLSASRNLDHMRAWLWLAGESELLRKLNDLHDYDYYGKPQLRAICEHYQLDWRALDDGRWRHSEGDKGVTADGVAAA